MKNEYPNLKPTTFTWHPATESPGKKRVLMVFRVEGHENDCFLVDVVRFLSSGSIPAQVAFKDARGMKKLAVAWAYYDEVMKGIAPWMISEAEYRAWPWWPREEKNKD